MDCPIRSLAPRLHRNAATACALLQCDSVANPQVTISQQLSRSTRGKIRARRLPSGNFLSRLSSGGFCPFGGRGHFLARFARRVYYFFQNSDFG
jgi:hypothetical protein